jgi:hypothetical protein
MREPSKTGSFKVGVLNKLSGSARPNARGVVTVSAGITQALAWRASAGIHAVVVMPEAASRPKSKRAADTEPRSCCTGHQHPGIERARELEKERNLVFVHPFDDEVICTGAGTAEWSSSSRRARRGGDTHRRGRIDLRHGRGDQEMNPGIRVFGVERAARRRCGSASTRGGRHARIGEHDRRRPRRADGRPGQLRDRPPLRMTSCSSTTT